MKAIVLNNNFLPKFFNSLIIDSDFILPEDRILMKNKIKNQKFELINNKENVKNYLNISSEAHQILLGSILGDMHLKKECKNSNIEETHSVDQKDYLGWKYKILSNSFDLKLYTFNNPICKVKERVYNRKTQIRLRNRVSEKLNLYYDLFYKDGVKNIPISLLNQLDTLALAVWYCDDGYYDPENHVAEIHTEGFSIEENQILKRWFNEKWNINVNFKKDPSKKKVLLRFPVKETNKFLNLIKGHIFEMPQSIWYKLGHFWEGNKEIIDKAKLNKSRRTKLYQSKEEIKVRRRQQTKGYYYRHREKILRKRADYYNTKKFKDYIKKYNQMPEVIKRRREREKLYRQNPEYEIKRALYQEGYRKRPEVKAKIKEYNKRAREKLRGGSKLRV